jgi:hypothetical protein
MATTIQLRRGSALAWQAANPILAEGEMGVESDTLAYKIGDGMTAFALLPYRQITGVYPSLLLEGGSDPGAPAADHLLLYAQSFAGRMMPKWLGPSGLDTAAQPAFFNNGIQMIAPGGSTTFSVLGMAAPGVAGTVSHPAITVGGLRLQTRRGIVTSAATAGSASELRTAALQCYRGDNTGGMALGGFFTATRFSVSSTVPQQRAAVGLWGSTGSTLVTLSPSTLTNCIIAGWDSTDSNLNVMHNDASGTCTKIDLGASFPATDPNAVYELMLFAAPNSNSVGWRVKRLDVPATAAGTITSDLPALSTLLSWHAYANNGTTAAAVVLELMRFYLETDF